MQDSFNPVEYLAYLRGRWRSAAVGVGTAVLATVLISWMLPDRYTATATLLIDPPSANDPRNSTAVSSVYLESLRAYEEFVSSDSLFAKACEKFHLSQTVGTACTDSFKRSVVRVSKLKDTKILRIAVTLPEPAQAQALVQYLADQTVELNRRLATEGDRENLDGVRKQLAEAQGVLAKARADRNSVGSGGRDQTLSQETQTLSDLIGRVRLDLLSSQTDIAEHKQRAETSELATEEARADALRVSLRELEAKREESSSALAGIQEHVERADEALRLAQADFDTLSRRASEIEAASGSRAERLRVIDPGVVPQQRSFPNPALFCAVAFFISSLLCLGLLTLQFGLERHRQTARALVVEIHPEPAAPIPSEIRVSRSASR